MKQMPAKPPTMKGQVDTMWDVLHNHVLTQLNFLGIKVSFILGFLALILALLGILIVKLG